ncbi:serine/threonine-protein kinase MARK1-like [Talpa occidentalis]|uniref:serine/threonine-protein kinase MARK1-like n=1 Tax=Talpa occidentalis TaxID=50954 RepID=UPI00188EFFA2|nr:serine/threonine-protein kinase MARK1-like [Talpa occidentalis]
MVTGELPFEGNTFGELRARVLSGIYHEPHYLSQQCRDLLKKMMTLDPQSRSTLDSIIKHPWVGLPNGLPPCRKPSLGQHEAATETMVCLGIRKEDIDRALLEAREPPSGHGERSTPVEAEALERALQPEGPGAA